MDTDIWFISIQAALEHFYVGTEIKDGLKYKILTK